MGCPGWIQRNQVSVGPWDSAMESKSSCTIFQFLLECQSFFKSSLYKTLTIIGRWPNNGLPNDCFECWAQLILRASAGRFPQTAPKNDASDFQKVMTIRSSFSFWKSR